MAKEKKITVKFFPKKLKSFEDSYEIYCRVIYNKKSTMFSLNHSFTAKSIENAKAYLINLLGDNQRKFGLGWKKTYLEKIIRKEVNKYGENYAITGFGERSQFYLSELARSLTFQFNKALLLTLQDILTYNQYIKFSSKLRDDLTEVKFFRIFESLKLLRDSYAVSLEKIIDQSMLMLLLAAGNYNAFVIDTTQEFEEKNNIRPTLLERIPLDEWMHGSVEIGQWFLNENEEKKSFLEYYSATPKKNSISEKVKNKMKEFSFKTDFEGKSIVEVIDFYIDTNIKLKL